MNTDANEDLSEMNDSWAYDIRELEGLSLLLVFISLTPFKQSKELFRFTLLSSSFLFI